MKRRATSAAAILSLALGIGACTAAFRLIDALLLRPLQTRSIARLVTVDVFSMVMVGALVGLALGMAAARSIETPLYEVKPTDARMLAIPSLAILAAAGAAAGVRAETRPGRPHFCGPPPRGEARGWAAKGAREGRRRGSRRISREADRGGRCSGTRSNFPSNG